MVILVTLSGTGDINSPPASSAQSTQSALQSKQEPKSNSAESKLSANSELVTKASSTTQSVVSTTESVTGTGTKNVKVLNQSDPKMGLDLKKVTTDSLSNSTPQTSVNQIKASNNSAIRQASSGAYTREKLSKQESKGFDVRHIKSDNYKSSDQESNACKEPDPNRHDTPQDKMETAQVKPKTSQDHSETSQDQSDASHDSHDTSQGKSEMSQCKPEASQDKRETSQVQSETTQTLNNKAETNQQTASTKIQSSTNHEAKEVKVGGRVFPSVQQASHTY